MTHLIDSFEHEGCLLGYEVHGQGSRTLVYMNALLFDAGINRRMAEELARHGHRVVLLDLLGHGHSSKPRNQVRYRMDLYARQVLALLDALGLDEAVIGGPSLGANTSLFAAVQAPERVRALILEMPVLESAVPPTGGLLLGCLGALRGAHPVLRLTADTMRHAPRTGLGPLDSLLNAASIDPDVVEAMLRGLMAGPIAPTYDERRSIRSPALVLGNRYGLFHPFTDAQSLAAQLPNAQLVHTRSPLELRMRPKRLAAIMGAFLDDAWTEGGVGPGRANEAASS